MNAVIKFKRHSSPAITPQALAGDRHHLWVSSRDLGLFDKREEHRTDTLSRFEHWWASPVQIVLLFFGFANAGVPLSDIGPGTYYVLAALLLGKPRRP